MSLLCSCSKGEVDAVPHFSHILNQVGCYSYASPKIRIPGVGQKSAVYALTDFRIAYIFLHLLHPCMRPGTERNGTTDWFLTAPEHAIQLRRGDPLGLRNITNEAADLLAPGLTNRTIDARWLSILSWALVHSERAWKKAGGAELVTAQEREHRYTWLLPLELLWVKRSLLCGGEGYQALQWPGYRSLRQWSGSEPDFGMTERQRRNHRQLGAYGAYRVLLRTARFTQGDDGWTPDEHVRCLADYVDGQLEMDDAQPRWTKRPNRDASQWWLQTGWREWRGSGSARSPIVLTPSTSIKKLSADERRILAPALFDDEVRARTATAIDRSEASDYVVLCSELAASLPTEGGDARLRSLGLLARLNDAGVRLLRATAAVIKTGEDASRRIVAHDDVAAALDAFTKAATRWNKARHAKAFGYVSEADRLAAVATRARGSGALFTGFVDHHLQHGSGEPWLVRDDNRLLLQGARAGTHAGGFGYRLHALSRLALQCGVTSHIPPALSNAIEQLNPADQT